MNCEDRVIDFLKSQNWCLVARNLRLIYAEVDLLYLSPDNELVLVEVKASCGDGLRPMISKEQTRRLQRAMAHLLVVSPLAVRAHMAAVARNGDVQIYLDFLVGC